MTSTGTPIPMTWHEGAFRPSSAHWARRAEKEYKDGQTYRLADMPERSTKAHNHYFAVISNAWGSLPPLMVEQFPSPEHLRKYALIRAGYSNSTSMACGTTEAAKRFAAFIKPLDEFALVTVVGSLVYVFTAKSQSLKAMGDRRTFQQSKEAVLQVIADMLDATKDELKASEPGPLQYLAAG